MLRALLVPPPQTTVDVVRDPTQRRALAIELVIVGILTFGFSAVYAILSLIEAQLGAGIAHTTVALNPTRSTNGAIDFTRQVMSAIRLGAIASLGVYLLWRSGIRLNRVGLARRPAGADIPPGLVLAAVIGLPGIGLLALSRLLGINAQLIASPTDGPWWQLPVLILIDRNRQCRRRRSRRRRILHHAAASAGRGRELGAGRECGAARWLSPVSGRGGRRGKSVDGLDLRSLLPADRSHLAVGDRARDDRRGRVRGLRIAGRSPRVLEVSQ